MVSLTTTVSPIESAERIRVGQADGITGTTVQEVLQDIVDGNQAITLSATTLNTPTITGGTADNMVIGGTTPAAGSFTQINASGQIVSTETTGVAPFTIASTTQVGNLNVSQLEGHTWEAPGTIGSTTPNSGAFSSLSASGTATFAGASFSSLSASGPATFAGASFSSTVTAPTPTAGDNSTKVATTAFVGTALSSYAPLASPALTGTPTAPTQTAGDNSTKIATDAFVQSALIAAHRSYIAGLTLINDPTTPNTIIDVSAGVAMSDDQTTLMSLSAITKTTGGTWTVGSGNGGLDQGSVLASTWYHVYLIERTDTGVVDVLLSQAPSLAASVTATSASPAVFTWAGGVQALPFRNGCPVVLSGTSAPTGFTLGTTYYAVAANVLSGTFELAATQGGTAINSTSTGSGLTATSAPTLPTSYSKKRRIGSIQTDASSHILAFVQNGDEFVWVTPINDLNDQPAGTSITAYLVSVPNGVKVNVFGVLEAATTAVTTGVGLFSPDQSGTTTAINALYATLSQVSGEFPTSYVNVRTGTGANINALASAASQHFYFTNYGWIDTRGRFN